MRSRRVFHAVDSHTEGMPTRVIVGGVGVLPGATMAERRSRFIENSDDVRTLLMYEPRGHAAMSGAILQPPTRPDADWGVLFIEVSGCLPMCGHGTIGVATVLVETGMVEVTEPVTTIRLDTPAGLVVAEVAVEDGVAALGDDPQRRLVQRAPRRHRGRPRSRHGRLRPRLRRQLLRDRAARRPRSPVRPARGTRLLDAGLAIMDAINDDARPVHPERPDIAGCHHVYLIAPGSDARHSRHAMAIHPGWFDRSPCGTGTSARMAQLHARGDLPIGSDFVNESFIGTSFTGRLVEETTLGDGRPAVVPTITGRAWITGTAQYVLDPDDPFPTGFLL